MYNVLSRISGIIIAGTNIEDNEMLNDIRSLSNRISYPKYPKERLLEIILNPRLIAKDAEKITEKCSDFDFLSIRNQIIDDLAEKFTEDKEVIMMLRSFTNKLLDNNEKFHIHSSEKATCKESELKNKKNSLLQSLYKKCQEFGLPYGYLNIFSHEILLKITQKNKSIAKTMIHYTYNADELKEMLYLCCVNFRKALNVSKLAQVLFKTEKLNLDYLIALPEPVVEVLLQGIDFHKKCCRLTPQRIEEILLIYNQQYELFMSVKEQPLLAKLIMTHSNIDIMNSFLDVIAINNKKISDIHTLNSNLSSFLFSHLSGHASEETAEAQILIDLSKIDPQRCNTIISNAPLIKQMHINFKDICELAKNNPKMFDAFMRKNLDLCESDIKRQNFRQKFASQPLHMVRYN